MIRQALLLLALRYVVRNFMKAEGTKIPPVKVSHSFKFKGRWWAVEVEPFE